MPTEPRILRTADFGAFEPELRRSFTEAFHFAWEVGEESPEEQQRRFRFGAIIAGARSIPDGEPAAGIALVKECYALHSKICAYLSPDDSLRDWLATISASTSRVGKKIARLPVPTTKKPQRSAPSVLELRRAWTLLENQLRAVDEDYVAESVTKELTRLSDAASSAEVHVANVRALLKALTIPGKNEVVAAEQAKEVRAIAAAVTQVSRELKRFSEKCKPPTNDDTELRAYFERLAQAIPAQSTYEGDHGKLRHRTEVPWSFLTIPRDLPERRAAVLQALCTWDAEFFPLLPGAVRRDRRAPATSGGRGHHNWVLNGITAALVLLELVDAVPVAPKTTGKDLFKATIKRVERWIDTETSSGGFHVDATSQPSTRTRRRYSISRPLQARYPIKPG